MDVAAAEPRHNSSVGETSHESLPISRRDTEKSQLLGRTLGLRGLVGETVPDRNYWRSTVSG